MYTRYSATEQLVRPHRVLFTEEEERQLFQQWRETPEGRAKARLHQKLILNYGPIVYKIARAMDGYTGHKYPDGSGSNRIERDDLIMEGLAGLVAAADRFDLSKPWRFATYAQTWVRGVLYAYISRTYFIVNPCSTGTRKKMFFRLRSMIYRDKSSLGSFEVTPEMAEMFAKVFETTPGEVVGMLNMFSRPQESLSEPVRNSDAESIDTTKGDMMMDPRDAFAEFNQIEQDDFRRKVVLKAVAKLKPRDRRIFETQMLCDKDHMLTLEDLGTEFNISKERVRQLRDRATDQVSMIIRSMISRGEVTRTDLFG